jgi:hypothetical protein
MSTSPVQSISRLIDNPILSCLIVLLILVVLGCLIANSPSKDALTNQLNSRLREEKFAELYDEADDNVHLNVSKDKFVQRLKIAVRKLKAIDENLDFKRDLEAEKGFPGDRPLILVIQNLGKGDKAVEVMFHWDDEGQFFDLTVFPHLGTSEEFRVYGVSHQHLYLAGQMVE